MDLEAVLRESVAKVCSVPLEQVTRDTALDELGIDSLASAEVIFEVEIRLGRELPNQLLRQVQEVRTVGDVAQRMRAALEEPTPAP